VRQADDLRHKIAAMPMLPAERVAALQNLAAAEAIVDTLMVIVGWFRREEGVRHKSALNSARDAR